MLAESKSKYVKLRAICNELVFGGEDNPSSKEDDAVRSRAKDIVPNSADSFYAREDMGEPGQDPRDDENDQIDLPEALENLIELWIFFYEHG